VSIIETILLLGLALVLLGPKDMLFVLQMLGRLAGYFKKTLGDILMAEGSESAEGSEGENHNHPGLTITNHHHALKSLTERKDVAAIFSALQPIPARLVGGVVRDALVGIQSTDIDVAVDATPEMVTDHLQAKNIKVFPTGLRFGTVTAVIDGVNYQITSLRADISPDGRHTDVSFYADWYTDASRRDFTINAMYVDAEGRLYDYFGGFSDLQAGDVRFIGAPLLRIQEDYLRVLRYYRFLSRFGKVQGAKSLETILGATNLRAIKEGLKKLSAERITEELMKAMEFKDPRLGINMMAKDGVLQVVCDDFTDTELFNNLVQLQLGVKCSNQMSAKLRFLALFMEHDFSQNTFRFSKADQKLLRNIKDMALGHVDKKWILYKFGYDFCVSCVLLSSVVYKNKTSDDLAGELSDLKNKPHLKFPLTGHDVLNFNVPKGPMIASILAECERWWVEKDGIPPKEECLRFCENMLSAAQNTIKS